MPKIIKPYISVFIVGFCDLRKSILNSDYTSMRLNDQFKLPEVIQNLMVRVTNTGKGKITLVFFDFSIKNEKIAKILSMSVQFENYRLELLIRNTVKLLC